MLLKVYVEFRIAKLVTKSGNLLNFGLPENIENTLFLSDFQNSEQFRGTQRFSTIRDACVIGMVNRKE